MVDVSDLLGKPYSPHGRGPDSFDCYGLVIEVEKRYGIDLPDFDYQSYSEQFITGHFSTLQASNHALKIDVLVEGAVVLFENMQGFKTHIGVYIGNNQIVHCNKKGVRIEDTNYAEKFIAGVYIWQK